MEVYPSLAEGIGLENRQGCQNPRGFESLYLLHFCLNDKIVYKDFWENHLLRNSLIILSRGGAVVARRAHNPKVIGSNPIPATNFKSEKLNEFYKKH